MPRAYEKFSLLPTQFDRFPKKIVIPISCQGYVVLLEIFYLRKSFDVSRIDNLATEKALQNRRFIKLQVRILYKFHECWILSEKINEIKRIHERVSVFMLLRILIYERLA